MPGVAKVVGDDRRECGVGAAGGVPQGPDFDDGLGRSDVVVPRDADNGAAVAAGDLLSGVHVGEAATADPVDDDDRPGPQVGVAVAVEPFESQRD